MRPRQLPHASIALAVAVLLFAFALGTPGSVSVMRKPNRGRSARQPVGVAMANYCAAGSGNTTA